MGEVPAMPDGLDRLKQLLFDSEAETLAELARRIEILAAQTAATHSGLASALEKLSLSGERSRAEVSAQIDAIAARVGSDARLEASVAAILDGALRRAERDRHDNVADAVAPFVVNTVRTEIRNCRGELVEAIYPVTGQIVKAYVTSAMKDLVDQINRRLQTNPLMLRLRSLSTGRSVAELAIADSQRLEIEELFLIRRGTGELVERWPAEASGNRAQVMSGVLAAINDFATEAFDADGNTLRQIDLGESRIYLRESVTYLLAARCSGSAPVAIEQVLDAAFLECIRALGLAAASNGNAPVLGDLAETLTTSIEKRQAALAGRAGGVTPLKVLATLIALPLVAWISWTLYADWQTAKTERIAREILSETDAMRGYPASLHVASRGRRVTVSGLAPNGEAKRLLTQRLAAALPGVAVTDELATVPNPLADIEPELDRLRAKADQLSRSIVAEAEKQDRGRAVSGLFRVQSTLAAIAVDLPAADRSRVTEANEVFARALGDLAAPSSPESLKSITAAIHEASASLSSLLPAPSNELSPQVPAVSPAAAALAAVEHAESVAVALAQSVALQKALPVATPRERLEAWTRANAIFFSDEANYRQPAAAQQRIAEAAQLLSGNDIVLRVIGYTDVAGGPERNSPISLARANKVAADLVAAGVAPSRLVVLGRSDLQGISANVGTGSPNRRVEFEVGFDGEAE